MVKHWMKKAFSKHPGRFKEKAESAGKSTREYAAEKTDASGKLGKEARLAEVGIKASKGRSEDERKESRYGAK